jgi:hypothetical protein
MTSERDERKDAIARLIHSGLGGDARPDAAFRERTRQRLVAELRSRHPAAEFPEGILVLLGLMTLGAAAWLATQAAGAGLATMTRMPVVLVVVPLILNLAFVPFAGLAVLIRRKRHARSA